MSWLWVRVHQVLISRGQAVQDTLLNKAADLSTQSIDCAQSTRSKPSWASPFFGRVPSLTHALTRR